MPEWRMIILKIIWYIFLVCAAFLILSPTVKGILKLISPSSRKETDSNIKIWSYDEATGQDVCGDETRPHQCRTDQQICDCGNQIDPHMNA